MQNLAIVLASAVVWPAIQLAVFWLRFRHLPPAGPAEALVFLPMGLVAGVVLAALRQYASSPRQRRLATWGYLVACPFALLGSVLGGLFLPGVWGPLLYGAVPLAAGSLVGFAAGSGQRPR